MKPKIFIKRTPIAASAEELFRWHVNPGAFERLAPSWDDVRVVERTGGIEKGARVVLSMPQGPRRIKWVAEHGEVIEGREFRDVQLSGPFKLWEHVHRFIPDGPSSSILEDTITYAVPFGRLGAMAGGGFASKKIESVFNYRHDITRHDLAVHARHGTLRGDGTMKILVTGSTGLVGSQLVPFLTAGGHEVVRLVRGGAAGADSVLWNPDQGTIDAARLEGLDAVIHLAGENISKGRWSDAQKARIKDSRVRGTRLIAETLAKLSQPPRALLSASAIGYYGDRGNAHLNEQSQSGSNFLAEVCREWEAATEPASAKGIRVVKLRFGVILSPKGGALGKMLTPFKLGLGGKIGTGGQFMSWIAIDDVVGAIYHSLQTTRLEGPVNLVSPNSATNAEFTKTLGKVLKRPTIFPMPAFVARAAFGEMADELLLASANVQPSKLASTQYHFLYPELEPALRHLLGR